MFGGLGIGIDYPMFLGDGKDEAGNSLGKRFYSEETSLAGYSPTYPSYFNRANVHNGNFGTCGLTTQVPVPMRLDDYDSSGNRLRRENWIKIPSHEAYNLELINFALLDNTFTIFSNVSAFFKFLIVAKVK
mgnify:CR=1 FL=1